MLLLDHYKLLLLTLVLTVVAIACKFGGTLLASRVTGLGWRESAVIGTLMNTRGLTPLIVLNLALEKGMIGEALFAMLVIMALVTTFMAGPLLNLLDPNRVRRAGRRSWRRAGRARRSRRSRSPTARSWSRHTEAHAPSAAGCPGQTARRVDAPRELILARLVRPPRGASVRGGLQTEAFALQAACTEVQGVRSELLRSGIAARSLAFTSAEIGKDLVRLAEDEAVD